MQINNALNPDLWFRMTTDRSNINNKKGKAYQENESPATFTPSFLKPNCEQDQIFHKLKRIFRATVQ